jgi:hypothetical protein
MRLPYHIAASTAVSGIIYLTTKSLALSAASFIVGIFIDLDHILDVMREHGSTVTIKDFFQICHTAQFERIFLLCHGWEWLFVGTAIAWYTSWNEWVVGALIGYTHHMILDTIHNSTNLRSYSLLYRWKNDFHFDKVFTKMTEQKYNFK